MKERTCNQEIMAVNNEKLSNKNKTIAVAIITLITMTVEITFGLLTGSMALLADGIHMGTHTFALVITVIAYIITDKHHNNPNFAFSSGKISVLGGFTNAIILGITALYMFYEAIHRFINPEDISFDQALLIAIIGLGVNLICAILLSDGHSHHNHPHSGHNHGEEETSDHNLKAAYIHVITDALTSVLAIIALLIGKFYNQNWPDSLVAILGAIVILKWAFGLLLSSGKLLVDYHPVKEVKQKVDIIANKYSCNIIDFHLWNTSENHKTLILSISCTKPLKKEEFIRELKLECKCHHVTLEIQ